MFHSLSAYSVSFLALKIMRAGCPDLNVDFPFRKKK
jgi:hypothetical protein